MKEKKIKNIFIHWLLIPCLWEMVLIFFNKPSTQVIFLWSFLYVFIIIMVMSIVKIVRNAKEEKAEMGNEWAYTDSSIKE